MNGEKEKWTSHETKRVNQKGQPWVVDGECPRGNRNVHLFKTLFTVAEVGRAFDCKLLFTFVLVS